MRAPSAPIVVLGMHRSGTTMLVRWLMQAGVFFGRTRDPNEEAYWFLRFNDRLLAMAGARWDAPRPWLRLMEDRALVGRLQQWLASAWPADSGHARGFLGRTGWLRWRLGRAWPAPWGFKDPRTTLTWPIWRALFPQARVVFVVRHGVDVAASLVHRERKLREQTLQAFPPGKWRVQSVRCWDLEEAFSLWEAYLQAADRWQAEERDRAWLVLRYEDLLADPARVREELGAFLGLKLPPVAVDTSRRFAFRRDAKLVAFAKRAQRSSSLLQRWYPDD